MEAYAASATAIAASMMMGGVQEGQGALVQIRDQMLVDAAAPDTPRPTPAGGPTISLLERSLTRIQIRKQYRKRLVNHAVRFSEITSRRAKRITQLAQHRSLQGPEVVQCLQGTGRWLCGRLLH